jgi:hypothetical protein
MATYVKGGSAASANILSSLARNANMEVSNACTGRGTANANEISAAKSNYVTQRHFRNILRAWHVVSFNDADIAMRLRFSRKFSYNAFESQKVLLMLLFQY